MCIFQLLDLKKGFSLPLWVTASAKAAVKKLLNISFDNHEYIKIPDKNEIQKIKVHSVGFINRYNSALAITFANSGLDLDLTNNLEIWTIASFLNIENERKDEHNVIDLVPGDGVGINSNTSKMCISSFAKEVIEINLLDIIPSNKRLRLEIIFPKGKFLAERTSNKSFGIINGLSIIGTTAETHLSASPEQLQFAKSELDKAISKKINEQIIFVIGENGLDLAKQNNLMSPIIKVGNWIGPLLVYAASKKVKEILLLGYHGKLIKLAGGIFHTHNHLADARMEILVYFAVKEKLPVEIINTFLQSQTIDEALKIIKKFNLKIANRLLFQIANQIEIRSTEYIQKYLDSDLKIGAILFDRERKICSVGQNSQLMIPKSFTFKC